MKHFTIASKSVFSTYLIMSENLKIIMLSLRIMVFVINFIFY